MRFLAYGPIWAMAALVAVDSTSFAPDMTPQTITGAILAVLGWTIYYVLVKVFPAQVKAQKEQRDAFLTLLRDLDITKGDENE